MLAELTITSMFGCIAALTDPSSFHIGPTIVPGAGPGLRQWMRDVADGVWA